MIYADYAAIYDLIGQAEFTTQLVARALAALPTLPRRALDLACGTGAAALALARAGAEVVGIDQSPQMLAIARARARDAQLPVQFLQANLPDLPISEPTTQVETGSEPSLHPSSFDLVTCFYDSLNYLTGDTELELTLCAVARLLAPGGRVIFDLNTEYEFAGWDDIDQVVYDGDGVLVFNRLSYDAPSRLACGRIVWFVRDHERWWRGEETHTERAWADAEVTHALAAAGLDLVARRTPRWEPAPAQAPRLVYEALRPGAQASPLIQE